MTTNDLIAWQVTISFYDEYDSYLIFAHSRNHAIEKLINCSYRAYLNSRRLFEDRFKPEVKKVTIAELENRCFELKTD